MGTFPPPAGFIEQRSDNIVWRIKTGWEEQLPSLIPSLLQDSKQQSAIRNLQSPISIKGGRGPIQRLEINSQEAIIVRRYRRGGIVRHFTRDIYWDRPPRPFVELHCIEEVRRRGIPTVEVLGARVEWLVGGVYRGLLVTQEASGFHTLWNWSHTEKSVDRRQQTLAAVAQAVAVMHQAGIAHADLNPTNILVSFDTDSPQVLLLDFDRAQIFPGPVPLRIRESSLRRFQRFFDKYDVLQEWLIPTELEHFRQVYETTWELKKY